MVCKMNSRIGASGSGRSTRQLNINVMFGGRPALNMNRTPSLSHVVVTPFVSCGSPPPIVLQLSRIARLSRSSSSTTGHSSGDSSFEHDDPELVAPRKQTSRQRNVWRDYIRVFKFDWKTKNLA